MSVSTRRKSLIDTAGALAGIVAAGFLVWIALAPTPSRLSRGPVERLANVRIDAAHLSNVTGAGDVVIVEFTDFQCPFCGRHARDTFPTLRKDLIDAGKVRYASVNFPLERIHRDAVSAAKAAECAGEQGRFWQMHERLFSDPTATSPDKLDEHIVRVGVEPARFKACLSSAHVAAKVKGDQAIGQRLGISATPAFLVGRARPDGGVDVVLKITGAQPAPVFAQAVEDVRSGTFTKS